MRNSETIYENPVSLKIISSLATSVLYFIQVKGGLTAGGLGVIIAIIALFHVN